MAEDVDEEELLASTSSWAGGQGFFNADDTELSLVYMTEEPDDFYDYFVNG